MPTLPFIRYILLYTPPTYELTSSYCLYNFYAAPKHQLEGPLKLCWGYPPVNVQEALPPIGQSPRYS